MVYFLRWFVPFRRGLLSQDTHSIPTVSASRPSMSRNAIVSNTSKAGSGVNGRLPLPLLLLRGHVTQHAR